MKDLGKLEVCYFSKNGINNNKYIHSDNIIISLARSLFGYKGRCKDLRAPFSFYIKWLLPPFKPLSHSQKKHIHGLHKIN